MADWFEMILMIIIVIFAKELWITVQTLLFTFADFVAVFAWKKSSESMISSIDLIVIKSEF